MVQESLNISLPALGNVWQVHYDNQTRGKCWEGFQLYNNSGKLTPFFENSIIYELCENGQHMEGDWFGVLSWSFFSKDHRLLRSPAMLQQHLLDGDHDVLGRGSKSRNHNIILQADNYHKGYSDLFEKIIRKAGIDFDFRRIRNTSKNVFSNYVIAKPFVWDRYFNTVLKPCMDVMADENNTEIYEALWQDAKYSKSLRSQTLRRRFQEAFGKPYYTYHTFICERFWTLFLWMNSDIKFKGI